MTSAYLRDIIIKLLFRTGFVNIKNARGTNKLWNIYKPEKLKKKSEKSVDKSVTA